MRSLLLLLCLSSFSVHAAESLSDLHVRALQETTSTGIQTSYASDAQVENESLLRLEDPGLTPNDSKWKWEMGVKFQNLTPQGKSQMQSGQVYDLSGAGSTLFPIVDLGIRHPVYENETAIWTLGGRFDFGYTSQRNEVVFPTGIKAENSRLSTGLASVNLLTSARFQKLPRVEFEAGIAQGAVSYTQSSSDDSAHFSKQTGYAGWSFATHYWIQPDWSAGVEYARRDLSTKVETDLQNDNYSVGTRVMW